MKTMNFPLVINKKKTRLFCAKCNKIRGQNKKRKQKNIIRIRRKAHTNKVMI